jgi:uncharacterized membrane protein
LLVLTLGKACLLARARDAAITVRVVAVFQTVTILVALGEAVFWTRNVFIITLPLDAVVPDITKAILNRKNAVLQCEAFRNNCFWRRSF